MKYKAMIILLFACFSFLTGCEPNKYIDVSDQQKFKTIINSEFIILVDLEVIGVSFDANYKKNVDYVYLVKKPGISGPEVVFKNSLNKGTKIKIIGVFVSDSLFAKEHYYRVEIVGSNQFNSYVVLIYDSGDVDSQNFGLDEAIFKRIKPS